MWPLARLGTRVTVATHAWLQLLPLQRGERFENPKSSNMRCPLVSKSVRHGLDLFNTCRTASNGLSPTLRPLKPLVPKDWKSYLRSTLPTEGGSTDFVLRPRAQLAIALEGEACRKHPLRSSHTAKAKKAGEVCVPTSVTNPQKTLRLPTPRP